MSYAATSMTDFILVLIVLYATLKIQGVIRREYRPYVECRAQERSRGLPRGALAERWGHREDWITDENWYRLLKHVKKATRVERKRLLRQRGTA